GEVTTRLLHGDPKLAEALLRHPAFVSSGHVTLAASLQGDLRRQAAGLFLSAVRKGADFPWSGELMELFRALPGAEVLPLLRAQWSNLALRDGVLLALARQPEAVDRDKFLTGLESSDRSVTRACLE